MADNTTINTGSGGDSIATDDIGGVKYQRGKVTVGADGTNEGDVSSTFPLPTVPGTYHTGRLTRATVSASSSGDNSLVSATSSQTTKLYFLLIVNSGTADVNVKLRDGTTDKTGAMLLRPGGSLCLDFCGEPYVITSSNTALNLNLSAAVSVTGFIGYVKSA